MESNCEHEWIILGPFKNQVCRFCPMHKAWPKFRKEDGSLDIDSLMDHYWEMNNQQGK